MKGLFVLVLLGFVVSLAIVLGTRLPIDAVTVIVGVGCGVLASIPTSLLIVAVTTRRENHTGQLHNQQTYPPVVVVNAPPGHSQLNPGWPAPGFGNFSPVPSNARQFHVIGEDEEAMGQNPYANL